MGTETGIFIPAFLKVQGTWESSGVPNIELAMMQLISRKALETDLSLTCRNYRIPITLEGCLPSKDPTYSTKIKLQQAKTMVKKPWMEGRLEYTMLPDGTITGVNFVECAGGKIIIMSCLIRT
jgi:hypothetical protein